MRTVRLCAIIAIGVAMGYAFDDSAATKPDSSPASTLAPGR
jgi:hypothetical protein